MSVSERFGDLPHEEIEPHVALGACGLDLVGWHRRRHRQEIVDECRERFGNDQIIPFDPTELARQPVEPAIDGGFTLVIRFARPVGRQRPVNDDAFRKTWAFGHGLERVIILW